jgi:hypothetical protein
MHIRSMNAACNTGDIYLTVRIRDVNSLGLLLEEAETQHTCNIMQHLIAQLDYNITGRITPTITIDKSDIYNYQNDSLGHIILNTYLLYSRWLFVPVSNQTSYIHHSSAHAYYSTTPKE